MRLTQETMGGKKTKKKRKRTRYIRARVAIKREGNREREALMRGGDLAMLNEASSDSVIMSGFLCVAG